jgi:hypothetical protein
MHIMLEVEDAAYEYFENTNDKKNEKEWKKKKSL